MTTTSAILLFTPPQGFDRKARQNEFLDQLQAHGFQAVVCHALSALYEQIQSGAAPAGFVGSVPPVRAVVLSGASTDNLAAAAGLRVLYPALAIVTVVAAGDNTEAILALQGGADSVFFADTPGPLRMALLMALLRCGQAIPADVDRNTGEIHAKSWVLQEKGWVLNSPGGIGVDLTTSERAFMLVLLDSADRQAFRADLLRAIDGGSASVSGLGASRRLGVIVSRMRRKFQGHQLDLPLQAVHGVGYMFTAPLQ